MNYDSFLTPLFFRKLQQLKIHTRRAASGQNQGGHSSLRRGHGLEFADFVPYAPGMDFRHIDWNALARTDRLFVRQFREERDLNVVVLLDTSGSMNYPPSASEHNKLEFAKGIALALAYIALADGDTVRVIDLARIRSKKGMSPAYRNPKSLSRIVQFLKDAEPAQEVDISTAIRHAIAGQKLPGKCFLVSDFLYEEEKQIEVLDILRGKSFDVAAVRILSPEELSLAGVGSQSAVRDIETGEELEIGITPGLVKEYKRVLADHLASLERYCARNRVEYILLSSDESLESAVLKKLPAVGILH